MTQAVSLAVSLAVSWVIFQRPTLHKYNNFHLRHIRLSGTNDVQQNSTDTTKVDEISTQVVLNAIFMKIAFVFIMPYDACWYIIASIV